MIKHFVIFIVFLMFASVNVFSQNFSLRELLILQKCNLDKFDSIAIKKGYQFQEIKQLGTDTFYSYAYQLDISTGRAAKFLQYAKPTEGTFVAYVTLDVEEYSQLKSQAKKIGFTFF